MTTQGKVYLQFGGAFCGNGPMLTQECEWKVAPLWWQEKGLQYTATGYGSRIPSSYMVKYNGRWRRVYVCIYGNAGTAYIGPSKAPIATVDGPY
jgi:hypothetical protein